MTKQLLTTFIILICLSFTHISEAHSVEDTLSNEIEIWPGVGPGSDTLSIEENIIIRSLTGTCSRDWAIEKITVPTITPMLPENPNGSAVIICPGGAYQRVVCDVEGIDIGNWLNSIGITAFVLKYRLPSDDHIDKKNVPLQDAQRALRYVRANAEQWGLDSSKIGIMGASAGGHMASTLASSYDKNVYSPKDYVDSVSARPDFMLLLYPVISMESGVTHSTTRQMLLGSSPDQATINEFSAEKNVTKDFPITFMTRAADDNGVSAENCNLLYVALQDSGIASTLKIFDNGGHGVGICKSSGSDFENWPDHCTNWLHANGFTEDSVIIEIEEPQPTNIHNNKFSNSTSNMYIYPNPVNELSNLFYVIHDAAHIQIDVYDVNGKHITNLVEKFQLAGEYSISLSKLYSHLNGIYFIILSSQQSVIVEKIIMNGL